MIVGQGPTGLAVGAGGGCLEFLLSPILSLSLSLGDGPIETEILSQRPLNPKQPTNQPTFESESVISGSSSEG